MTFQGSRWSGWVQIFVLTLSYIQDIMPSTFRPYFICLIVTQKLPPIFSMDFRGPWGSPKEVFDPFFNSGDQSIIRLDDPNLPLPQEMPLG